MRIGKVGILLSAIIGSTPALADALSTPSLSGPLAANPNPMNFDAGPLGKIYVTGVVSGLALYQTNHTLSSGDHELLVDFSNAQVFAQKTDGLVQFYVQAGEYAIPSLGLPYLRATDETSATYGPVPVAYLKIAPSENFNVEAGKLPTLLGEENTFDFQNPNIERGLLWNQTPGVNRGVQANYTQGPLAVSLSWNDGIYSNRFNWLSTSIAYTVDSENTVTFLGGGDLGSYDYSLPPQSSSSIYDLIWAHTSGPWMIMPYVQYTRVLSASALAATPTVGGALFAGYTFNSHWNLSGRFEYIAQTSGVDSVLYGPKSTAWSLTLTPTYQYSVFFARTDFSYVGASKLGLSSSETTPGPGFGTAGNATGQFRAMLEAGILF